LWKKECSLYSSRMTAAYLVLAPTLSQLRSWLWRLANPAVRQKALQVWGFGQSDEKRSREI
jgi:hypothetical protein